MSEIEAQRKAITVRGLSGLRNLGNTCYMNASLQCLFATNLLTEHFINKHFLDYLKENTLDKLAANERKAKGLSETDEVDLDKEKLVTLVKSSLSYIYFDTLRHWLEDNNVIVPQSLKRAMGKKNDAFSGYNQQDSHEFIIYFLDGIHENLKSKVSLKYKKFPDNIRETRKVIKKYNKIMKATKTQPELFSNQVDKRELMKLFSDYIKRHYEEFIISSLSEYWENYIQPSHSIISDLMTGLSYKETTCSKCSIISLSYEPYIIASIDIPKLDRPVTIYDCFDNFTRTETLSGDNSYMCSYCSEQTPAVQSTKFWYLPEILIIQLKRFSSEVIGNMCRTSKNSTQVTFPLDNLDLVKYLSPYKQSGSSTYSLYGVVKQHGSLNGGHYVACTKNSINNKWYQFDDSNVMHIPDDKINGVLQDSSSYILFYQKSH